MGGWGRGLRVERVFSFSNSGEWGLREEPPHMGVERCVDVPVPFLQNKQENSISSDHQTLWSFRCFFSFSFFLYSPLVYNSDEPQLKHAKLVPPLSTAAEVLQPRMGPLHQPHLHRDMGLDQPNTHENIKHELSFTNNKLCFSLEKKGEKKPLLTNQRQKPSH